MFESPWEWTMMRAQPSRFFVSGTTLEASSRSLTEERWAGITSP